MLTKVGKGANDETGVQPPSGKTTVWRRTNGARVGRGVAPPPARLCHHFFPSLACGARHSLPHRIHRKLTWRIRRRPVPVFRTPYILFANRIFVDVIQLLQKEFFSFYLYRHVGRLPHGARPIRFEKQRLNVRLSSEYVRMQRTRCVALEITQKAGSVR